MGRKGIILGIIAATMLLFPCLGWAQGSDTTYVAGEALIKVHSPFEQVTKEDSLVKTGVSWFDTLSQQYGIYELSDVFRSSQPRFQGYYKLEFPTTVDVMALCSDFASQSEVEYAEPNYIYRFFGLPDDSLYVNQWALRRIQALEAWDVTTGSEEVILAIVDSGSDTSHPDLKSNLWRNPGEIPDNGIDDDGNGYVDDYYGYDFYNNYHDPTDKNGHGTHVAGIAAAVTNNTSGIAGLAGGWYPLVGVKIMSVKCSGYFAPGDENVLAEAIRYAADPDDDPTIQDGAGVINMSWGGRGFSLTIYRAITYADSQDVVLVASAGNDCGDMSDRPNYPAAWDECISVASIDSNDIMSSFSTCADWVDVSAPGGASGLYVPDSLNILSTTPTYPDFTLHYNYPFLPMNYGYLRGTSMASPYVAGLAALIRSLYPNLSNRDVRGHILGTADELYPDNEDYVARLGAGRINAYRALTEAPHPSLVYWGQQIDDSEGSNDGAVNVGETVDFTVELKNFWIEGIGISGRLATSDPGIVINKNLGSFGTIGNERTGDNSADPFNFTVALGSSPRKALFNLHLWTQDSTHYMDVTVPVDIGASLVGNFPFRIGSGSQSSPMVIDLDGDGSKEIVVGADDGKLYVVSHDGELEETFQTGGAIRSSPAIADLDGDGDLELIVGSDDQKVYAWHHTNPTNPIFAFNTGGIVRSSPAIGDVNGDGGLEIVIGSVDTIGADLYVLSPSGSVVWSFSTGRGVEASPGLADVTGDGVPDVIAFTMAKTQEDTARVYAFDVKGDSVIWSRGIEVTGIAMEIIGSPVIADIDEDGSLEILFYAVNIKPGQYYGSDFALNAQDGSDFWTDLDQRLRDNYYWGKSFVVGDIFPDQPGLESSGPSGYWYGDEVDILASTGEVLFINHDYGRTGIPVIADVDNNGHPEMVYPALGRRPTDKGVGEICALDKDNQMLSGWPAVVGDTVSSSLAVDDLDGDGLTDIVFVTQNGNVYALDTGLPFNKDGVEWGMYQHDRWHTGLYGAQLTRRVSGHITKNTTWSDEVVVLGDVTVDSGVVLTVQPGTDVIFMPNQDNEKTGVDTSRCELIIEGELIISGAGADSVALSSPVSGGWYGVRFNPECQGQIQRAILENGHCGIFLDTASVVTIEGSSIRGNQLCGICCEHADSATAISSNTISGNHSYGVYAEGCSPSIIGNNFSYPNQDYAIKAIGSSPDREMVIRGNTILMPVLACEPPRGGDTTSTTGIYIEDASAQIEDNYIGGGYYGIQGVGLDSTSAIRGSSPLGQVLDKNLVGIALYADARPSVSNNKIFEYRDIGVACYESYPLLGDSLIPGTGNNSITPGSCSPQYAVYCEGVTDTIKAEVNFWGGSPPDPSWFLGPVDYDPWLTAPPVGVEATTQPSLPNHFSLSQNYPNPFNPITQIRYALPRDCWVRLEIYNILGQRVAKLLDERQRAGYKTARWDASGVASGVYIYRIQAGDFAQTRRMILLK